MHRTAFVASSLAVLATGCQLLRDRDSARILVAELTPRLEQHRSTLGGAVIDGEKITLLGGDLTLIASIPHDEAAPDPRITHVHVLAKLEHRKTAPLDFCVMGSDFANAAKIFVEHALPPLASVALKRPALGAGRVWGDSKGGVPGHAVYAGNYLVRGDVDFGELASSGIYRDPPPLPSDGRVHLLKVLYTAADGQWRRTLELDGPKAIESNRVIAEASGGGGLVVGFALIDDAVDPLNDPSARAKAIELLGSHPKWLPDPQSCPADHLPAVFLEPHRFDHESARGGRLLLTIESCGAGEGDQCYQAAQDLLAESSTSAFAQSLFMRACQLGKASGCTNAAAGREQGDCTLRTYEASCEKGKDPWGCSMFAHALINAKRELPRARAALAQACAHGPSDPACQVASEMLKGLDAASKF